MAMKRAFGFLLLAAVAGAATVAGIHLRERTRGKTTADRIRVLSTILLAERPPVVTPDVLARLAAKYKRSDVLTDGWGRAITVRLDGGKYLVTSFARDGVSSGCCVPAGEASPDTDLIALDGEWKQIWN
jgi:hypothetical protein